MKRHKERFILGVIFSPQSNSSFNYVCTNPLAWYEWSENRNMSRCFAYYHWNTYPVCRWVRVCLSGSPGTAGCWLGSFPVSRLFKLAQSRQPPKHIKSRPSLQTREYFSVTWIIHQRRDESYIWHDCFKFYGSLMCFPPLSCVCDAKLVFPQGNNVEL